MLAALLLAALAAPTTQDDPTAGIDGRFLLPSGAPAIGATWRILGRAAGAERIEEFGRPVGWKAPAGTVDDDGRLRARFDAPGAYEFTLWVQLDGHVPAYYRWERIGRKQVIDVGELSLRPAGRLAGRILDGDGRPLTGRTWIVRATQLEFEPEKGRTRTSRESVADSETARFEIDLLPEGPVEVTVTELRGASSRERLKARAVVVPGRAVRKDLMIANPDGGADEVVVRLRAPERYGAMPVALPSPRHVWLVAEDGSRRRFQGDDPRPSEIVFDEVGAGPYRVEIDDPSFAPWSKDGVMAGESIEARPAGSAAVRLDVHDTAGDPFGWYEADLTLTGETFRPDTFRVADIDAPLTGGLLDGLVPDDYGVTVRADGLVGYARVDALAAGETREVSVTLRRPAITRAVVRFPDGAPAPDMLVRLVTPAKKVDRPGSMILPKDSSGGAPDWMRRETQRARTDDDGAYAFTIEVPGRYVVVVGGVAAPQAECPAFEVKDTAPEEITITVERGGALEGTIDFPAGYDPRDRRVWFERLGSDPGFLRPPFLELDEEGRFSTGPLVPGLYDFFVDRYSPDQGIRTRDDGVVVGRVELVDGRTIERTFDFLGGASLPVTFDLTPSEVDGDAVRIVARSRPGGPTGLGEGTAPRVGPVSLPPGTYDVWFQGPDWLARLEGWSLGEVEAWNEVVDLDLWTRRVRLVQDGKPLAGVDLTVTDAPGELRRTLRTDDQGRVELRLGAATYTIEAATTEPSQKRRIATIEWPLGEGVEDVVFR